MSICKTWNLPFSQRKMRVIDERMYISVRNYVKAHLYVEEKVRESMNRLASLCE